jgi:serine/threonine protein kinase
MDYPIPKDFDPEKHTAKATTNDRVITITDVSGVDINITIQGKIAAGTYGTTYKTDAIFDDAKAVVKVIEKDAYNSINAVIIEVIIQILLVNLPIDPVPICPRLYIFAQDDKNYYIVMEHIVAPLMLYLKHSAKVLVDKLCMIVYYLQFAYNHLKFNHRDLKSDNILVDSKGYCRIIDFGFSCLTYGKMKIESEYKFPKEILHHCDKKTRDVQSLFYQLLYSSELKNKVCPFKHILKVLLYEENRFPKNWKNSYTVYNRGNNTINLMPMNVYDILQEVKFRGESIASEIEPNWAKFIKEINNEIISNLTHEEINYLDKTKLLAFLKGKPRFLIFYVATQIKDEEFKKVLSDIMPATGGSKRKNKTKKMKSYC